MSFWATVAAVHFTLFFNVYLHHDDDVDPAPMPETGKYRCRAHDKLPRVAKVVFDLVSGKEGAAVAGGLGRQL